MEWINALYQLLALVITLGIFAVIFLFVRSQMRRTKQLRRIEQDLTELKTAALKKESSSASREQH